jgi:hypothetical protein
MNGESLRRVLTVEMTRKMIKKVLSCGHGWAVITRRIEGA